MQEGDLVLLCNVFVRIWQFCVASRVGKHVLNTREDCRRAQENKLSLWS